MLRNLVFWWPGSTQKLCKSKDLGFRTYETKILFGNFLYSNLTSTNILLVIPNCKMIFGNWELLRLFSSALWQREKWPPKDVHVLTLRTCEYVMLHCKMDSAYISKTVDQEMWRLSRITLMGPIQSRESLNVENFSWLCQNNPMRGLDQPLLALKIEKGSHETRNVVASRIWEEPSADS